MFKNDNLNQNSHNYDGKTRHHLLLFASALAKGTYIYGNKIIPVDFLSCLREINPDFVFISLWQTRQNWTELNQPYHNALEAGFPRVHFVIFADNAFSFENMPANFTGRVWVRGTSGKTYSELTKVVENIASLGYEVGILDSSLEEMTEVVPGVLSSLPLTYITTAGPWKPVAGWNCPSINMGKGFWTCDSPFTFLWSLTVNADCI